MHIITFASLPTSLKCILLHLPLYLLSHRGCTCHDHYLLLNPYNRFTGSVIIFLNELEWMNNGIKLLHLFSIGLYPWRTILLLCDINTMHLWNNNTWMDYIACRCYVCYMLFFFMLSFLFFAVLWSPAGKAVTSWLSWALCFLVICQYPIWFSGTWLYRFLIFTFMSSFMRGSRKVFQRQRFVLVDEEKEDPNTTKNWPWSALFKWRFASGPIMAQHLMLAW